MRLRSEKHGERLCLVGHQNTFHNNVTVNATGGRPQDHQGLAEHIGHAVKEAASAMMAKELRTQMTRGFIIAKH